MSDGAIFVVGIIIFAITIYGAVMAGGIALTYVALEEEPGLEADGVVVAPVSVDPV
jgi:hypothetical protein